MSLSGKSCLITGTAGGMGASAAKHAWPHLKRSTSPAVVLVGSTAGISGSMSNARVAHTVTKGAVVAMTKQLAAEGAPYGIRVNCVSPGMVETPATRGDLLSDDHPMRTIPRWSAVLPS